jgi:hypothetical protein
MIESGSAGGDGTSSATNAARQRPDDSDSFRVGGTCVGRSVRFTAAEAGKRRDMARLEDYSFGRLTVDGQEHTRDLIVLPDRVVGDWWRREGHSLAMDDLEEVIDDLPGRLVVGIGAHSQLRPDPAVIADLERRGVQVECLPTDAAVRRYGELDERGTAAALHLTC